MSAALSLCYSHTNQYNNCGLTLNHTATSVGVLIHQRYRFAQASFLQTHDVQPSYICARFLMSLASAITQPTCNKYFITMRSNFYTTPSTKQKSMMQNINIYTQKILCYSKSHKCTIIIYSGAIDTGSLILYMSSIMKLVCAASDPNAFILDIFKRIQPRHSSTS